MTRLYRSKKDKIIAGICGGISEILKVDPSIIRLLLVFIALVTGVMPLVLTYIVAWLIIPEKAD